MNRVPAALALLLLHQEADARGDESLRIGGSTLRKWVERGHITRGPGGYDLAEILAYLEQRERSTSVEDLITWLRAQLDEDERIARAASRGPWTLHRASRHGRRWADITAVPGPDDDAKYPPCVIETESGANPPAIEDAEHIAHFDPRRQLDDVIAKRQIIGLADEWRTAAVPGADFARQAAAVLIQSLRLLALPYADRPGYLEEWKP